MGKGKPIIIIVVILVVVVGAILFIPALAGLLGNKEGMSVTFYDADGNAISDTYAFQTPLGDIVSSFQTKIWWTVDGTNIDLSTFSISGRLLIQVLSTSDRWNTLDEVTWTKGNEGEADSDYTTEVYDFATLLNAYMTEEYKASGWVIKLTCTLTIDMDDTGGNSLDTQTKDLSSQFTMTWYEGSFSVESGITYVQT